MLSENIRNMRRAKALSQEELAAGLNVVRQTVSKWENGLSVPDADMLISISQVLDTPVSALLGETVVPAPADDMQALAEKLEAINRQLAERKRAKWRIAYWLLISLSVLIIALFAFFIGFQSQYLNWNYADPETAVAGTLLHAVEYVFVRAAPVVLACSVTGSVIAGRKLRRPYCGQTNKK